MNHYEEQKQLIAAEIAKFPATFGMRAFPGDVFRVSPKSSYVSEGKVMLYTEIQKGDKWLSFAKGSPSELRREVVELEPQGPEKTDNCDKCFKPCTSEELRHVSRDDYDFLCPSCDEGRDFNLMEFRDRYPFKPNDIVLWRGDEREVISYPWPDREGAKINIRVPGDPTTMHEVDCIEIGPPFTETEKRTARAIVERAFLDWAIGARADRGDNFSTERELRNIATDPLAFDRLLQGEDAYEFLRRMARLFV